MRLHLHLFSSEIIDGANLNKIKIRVNMYFLIKIKLQHCVLCYNFIVTSFFIIMFNHCLTSEDISDKSSQYGLRTDGADAHGLLAVGRSGTFR
jgi:hypothetical protein